ncbi:MAG: hypothetical protein II802_00395, partial [Clostridia bacterium]|nr:hypothetical protein [Clostridia bacterium]
NNIKYYNDSLAYDFEMFMPKEKKAEVKDNIVALPKKKAASGAKHRSAARGMSASAFSIMAAAFILMALCGNIALRLQINEVNSKISDMKASVAALESEKTALSVEMQRRISYANIELEATQLGMKKMSKDQVVYIRVNDKNAAKTSDGNIVTEE